MDELLDAIVEGLKKREGELPDIHLIAMELVATSNEGIKCRVQGTKLTKVLLENLEISNEELDRMLRPAAKCLKEFADCLIEKMDEKNEEMRKEILKKLSKIN
ncbi:hypothetical protein DWX89_09210 [Coprobacillus sp. AF21-8LB]|nr:hypothetical protein DWX89_09210 [Coprobacillus sp. AF21-8LB]